MNNCMHKYIHKNTDSYWYFSGRNYITYEMIDVYFCEKCLDEKEIKKTHSCYYSEKYNLPDWAKNITKHTKQLDASYN